MAFHNLWNFRESALAQTLTYNGTDFYVNAGTGVNFPPVPFIMTITVDYTLDRLKQSERIAVTAVDSGDSDHFTNCIRNFDNPLVPAGDVTTPGTEAREHIVGEKTAVLLCSYNIEELQTAVEALQAQPYPDDITGDTATLVNQIQVGDVKGTFSPAAGMIRWAGGHFQGYTGSAWVDLDDTSGGGWTPPAGTDGQIMFWDSGDWAATSRIFIDTSETKIENIRFNGDDVIISGDIDAVTGDIDTLVTVDFSADTIKAKSLFTTDIDVPEDIPGLALVYDITGTYLGNPGGLIIATSDFDPATPTGSLTDLGISADNFGVSADDAIVLLGGGMVAVNGSSINFQLSKYVFDDTLFVTSQPMKFTPTSSVPATPANGYIYYDSSIGFRVYQAGAWHTITNGVPGSLPPGGTAYGTLRYNPTIGIADWEYTDKLLIQDDGAYFDAAIIVGERKPTMIEVPGLIEFRNNDIMGYVNDPDGIPIEVSLTNVAESQRFPSGVDTGTVDGDYLATATTINLFGLTVEVTDGEQVSFEGDLTGEVQNYYTIVSHTPADAPTQQIVITPGLVNAVDSGTNCNARSYRMLYHGLDGVWHSSRYARIVPNSETIDQDLMRVQSIQIGANGQNGYEGTIRWNDGLKELQWHNGSSWNSWPVSAAVPAATAPEGSIMATDATGGYSWELQDQFRVLSSGVESDVSITTPVLILDDGAGNTKTLTPDLFELGDFTVDSGVISTFESTVAKIDTLTVGTLITADPEEPTEITGLSGARLDLRVNGVQDRDIFSFIAGADDLTIARNVSLLGIVVGPIDAGETVIPVSGFSDEVVDGYTVRFEDDPNIYVIASHTGDPTTEIVLVAPGLYEEVLNGAIVSTAAPDSELSSIAIIDSNAVNWELKNIFDETEFSKHAIFDYTLQVGLEEPGVPEAAGMIRFNGDFQGRLDNGQWASFTLGLAGGEIDGNNYGTLLYWNGTTWTKNTSVRASGDGTLLLSSDTGTTAAAGALRWNGSDFQGFNGSIWVSLTGAAATPSLPSGVGYPDATLRWDGTAVDWLVNPNVTTDLSQVTTPLLELWDYASFSELGRIDNVGGYPIGTTVLSVDTFYGQVIDGNTILIIGDTTVHTIISHLPVSGPTTQITIEPAGLIAAVSDNATITVQEALVRPTPGGGQIRYNQNDYEGYMEEIGWVSFTGHVNYLPTKEGDPLLEQGHLLKFNGDQWVAEHDVKSFQYAFKIGLDLEVQGNAYFYEPMYTEAIKLGDKMPTSKVDTSDSTGDLSNTEDLPVGTTAIPVTNWDGPIFVGSYVSFSGHVDEYVVMALEPTIGDPTTITIASPGTAHILDGTELVSVDGVVDAQNPAPGTIYYNAQAQKFFGYNDDVWLLLGSPIQGAPTDDQVLRYQDPYWVPASDISGASYFEIQDTQLYATIPLRLDDSSSSDGWLLEQNYIVQGVTDVFALLIRGEDKFSEDPTWGGENIWMEFCTGTTFISNSYCKINTDVTLLRVAQVQHLTVAYSSHLHGTLHVWGNTQLDGNLTIGGNVDVTTGDVYVRQGDLDVADGIYGGFIRSLDYGYFESYVRIGYAEGGDNPIGSIRYSNPGNVATGDWEGWDGEKWVSFTHVDIGNIVTGVPVDGDMIYYDASNSRWAVTHGINMSTSTPDRTLPAIAITNNAITIGSILADDDVLGIEIEDISGRLSSPGGETYDAIGLKLNSLYGYGAGNHAYGIDFRGSIEGSLASAINVQNTITGLSASGIKVVSTLEGITAYGAYIHPSFDNILGTLYGLYIDATVGDGTYIGIHVETGDVEIEEDLYADNIQIYTDLNVDGSAVIDVDLDVGNDLDVTGSADIGVDLTVIGDIESDEGDLLLATGHGVLVDGDQIISDQEPYIAALGIVAVGAGSAPSPAQRVNGTQAAIDTLQAKIDTILTALKNHGLIAST